MIDIKEIAEKKPHLKDILGIYEKALAFNGVVAGIDGLLIGCESRSYPPEMIDRIFEEFSGIFDLPVEIMAPLKEAMGLGQVDLSRLPLKESPAFSLPYNEDELSGILFLLGRPYFFGVRDSCKVGELNWDDARCIVCNSTPSLASLDTEGRRRLHCSFCGTSGYFRRVGCPVCLGADTSKTNIITIEDEKGFRIDTCDACNSYWKTIDSGVLASMPPDLADIVSLPLDIIAQGRGYTRHSPNPIGLVKIT